MRKSFYAKYSLLILMAFFFAAPLLIQGAHRAIRSNTNKVVDWLPKSFKETQELRWFRQHFVADQFVVVSWPGCTLGDDPSLPDAKADDPRIERLASYLVPKGGGPGGADFGHVKYFQAVTTARRTLNELTTKPSEVPYQEAVNRLKGTLIGPDGRQTCVVIMLSDEAIKSFRVVVGRHVPNGPMPWHRQPGVLIEALKKCGIDPEIARLGGPPVENVAIDEEGDRTLARLASISGLLGLCLAWWSLRSVRLTLTVFGCGILSAAAGLAFVFWTGQTTDAVMMAMPSMLYVLAISGAVHLVNYYRDAVREHGLEGAPERAMSHGWKPAVLCNVTTGIGLASLATSDLEPIRKFGIYSAAGVALMLIFLFVFLPAALHFWPVRPKSRKEDSKKPADGDAHWGEGTIWYEESWRRFGAAIIRNHAAVALACFAFIAVVGLGLTRVRTNIDLLKLFDEGVRVRRDYAWLEEHVCRLVPLEVVIEFPRQKQRSASQEVDAVQAARTLSYLERLELVWLTQRTIDKELGPSGRNLVGPSLSPVTFAPPVPEGSRDSWAMARRRVTDVKLEESEAALERSGYLRDDPKTGTELWRISLRAAAFADLDYGAFVNNVRTAIEPVLAADRLREHVLVEIAKERQGDSVGGAKVFLWARNSPATPLPNSSQIEGAAIFSNALQELLGRARLKLVAANVDLPGLNEDERRAAIEYLKSFDCVAVVGPVSDAELRMIADAGVRVVDGRHELRPTNEESVATHANQSEITAVYTGVVPIVYKAQRALLENLIQSSFWSFVTITPLMMLVCRSISGGAVVMLPNVLPVLVVFGGMGWLGVPVDIGSMMAASIALGVAVDDTIHYLTWYREGLSEFGDRRAAIISAYKRCAPPTLQAAMISGLGLAVFALSTFTPTQKLGWLMMTILLAGVVAELIMLPAILAGPLGKVFSVQKPPAPSPVPAPHVSTRKGELVSSRT
jgi:predicted RND superfamily exporter protein